MAARGRSCWGVGVVGNPRPSFSGVTRAVLPASPAPSGGTEGHDGTGNGGAVRQKSAGLQGGQGDRTGSRPKRTGAMELRVGNRYRLGRKIGSGSFGDIYLGKERGSLGTYLGGVRGERWGRAGRRSRARSRPLGSDPRGLVSPWRSSGSAARRERATGASCLAASTARCFLRIMS